MRIAVVGATGATGRHVVAVALERGHEVVALARRPDALSDLAHDRMTVRQADVHVADTITSACRDVHAVISALGISKDGPAHTLSAGARAIADARPSRVAWMGSFGAGASRHRAGPLYDFTLRKVLGDGFADKAAADDVIAGPHSTVFHPVVLTGKPAVHRTRVVPLDTLERTWRFMPPRVTRADVAAALVDEIENPAYPGRTVAVF